MWRTLHKEKCYTITHACFVIHRKDTPMQRPPGFKTDAQREHFHAAAVLHGRGGPLSPKCGVRTRTGTICTQVPISEGKGRCLRHCGPDAAQAHRDAQLRQMQTGKTSPAEFARAEARRARNRLTNGWKSNPALPGQTIDLGAHEWAFQNAARALGADVGALYPAQADWLRWRYQRTQRDRKADAAWVRAVQVDLPRQIARAEAAMVWVRLGGLDKRTKEGRALKAALRAGGETRAAALALTFPKPPYKPPRGAFAHSVKVWAAPPVAGPSKRGLPDRIKRANPAAGAAPKALGRPRARPETEDELTGLMGVYKAADAAVRTMFQGLPDDQDRLTFLRALKALVDAPEDPSAHRRWAGMVQRLR